jgi:predicted nucleotidyltransferase
MPQNSVSNNFFSSYLLLFYLFLLTVTTENIILLKRIKMNKRNINRSIGELKETLANRLGNEIELYLFGSVARNDYRPGSDIDILVLVPGKVDTKLEIEILDLAYDIELKHDVVFGLVVNEKKFWNSKKASVMPFHQNLQREALRI